METRATVSGDELYTDTQVIHTNAQVTGVEALVVGGEYVRKCARASHIGDLKFRIKGVHSPDRTGFMDVDLRTATGWVPSKYSHADLGLAPYGDKSGPLKGKWNTSFYVEPSE
jgi:hypothetical protein